jgi:hypothetical protein
MTHRKGGGLKITPETDAENDYLINLDRDYLWSKSVMTKGTMVLEILTDHAAKPAEND